MDASSAVAGGTAGDGSASAARGTTSVATIGERTTVAGRCACPAVKIMTTAMCSANTMAKRVSLGGVGIGGIMVRPRRLATKISG